MNELNYDIIILGAGPAGSTATITLRNSGLKVAVLDKYAFPRDKICGDAVNSTTRRILRQLDPKLEQELLEFAPKTNITKAKLYSPAFESLEIGFPYTGHCIRRMDFDNWLYQKAQANRDATFIHNINVADISNANDIQMTLSDGRVLRSKLLLGCDGAQSVVAKKLAQFKVDRKHYSGAVRKYYRNIAGLEGNALEVYFLKNYLPGYFWIFPLSDNEANVGFGMLSETIASQKIDLKKSMDDIIQHIPEVSLRFKHAIPLEETKGFGLPLGSKKYPISGNGFMLCGDAASLIDPFSGEGIETAMESGKFAAEHAMQCFASSDFSASFMKPYDERVYRKMWGNFSAHHKLQRLLGDRVWLINALIRIGNIPWINKKIPKLFY